MSWKLVDVQSLSHVWLFGTPWTAVHKAALSFFISWNLLKLMSTGSVMLSNHIIFCCPLLWPSIFPSIRVFPNELAFTSGSQSIGDSWKWKDSGRQIPESQQESVQFSSVAQSCPASLWPHESQHARPPCPSPTPRAYPNSCSSSWWSHPTISSSVIPFSSHLQSFPAAGFFQMSQFFALGGQSIGVSASASVLPVIFRTNFL